MDSPSTLRLTSAVGLTTAFYLSGIGFSAAHLTLPPLYTLPTTASVHVFKPLYYEGAKVVGPLTALSTISFATAAYLSPRASPEGSILAGPRFRYATAAFFALLSLPYTQVVMMSGIQVLLDCAGSEAVRVKVGDGRIVQLLRTWKAQAMTRSAFYFIAGLLGWSVL